jgi:elongation factor Ts
MAITAALVKELREKTGAGMMDCKKALTENDGDMEAAVKFLREKGLAAAAKKAGRVAAEGLVDTFVDGNIAAIVEVNCETDFVAKNDDFIKLVKDLAAVVAKGNPGKLKAEDAGDGTALYDLDMDGKKVADVMTDKISTIGENMNIRRFQRMDDGDAYGEYLHMGGKIGVVVSLSVSDKADSETVKALAKDLAMHVASEAPLAIDKSGVDQAVIDNEKVLAESCLLDQAFVKDPDMKVSKLIDKTAKELGATISVQSFARFKVGDGIEKKDENFADEVAKMTGA